MLRHGELRPEMEASATSDGCACVVDEAGVRPDEEDSAGDDTEGPPWLVSTEARKGFSELASGGEVGCRLLELLAGARRGPL